MNQRVNISLSEETIRLIDRVSRRGRRGQLIDQAVRHYGVTQAGKTALRARTKDGAAVVAARPRTRRRMVPA